MLMHIRRIRLKKKYRLRFRLFLLSVFLLCLVLIFRPDRPLMASIFNNRKNNNLQQVYSKRLNDRLVDYSGLARMAGVRKSSSASEIHLKAFTGQLVRVSNCRYYKIERLTHSYPYLTPDGKTLLDEIGRRFREKTINNGYRGSRFIVTSMTRTSENSRRLGRSNLNASENSPHLNGNAFDISYARFHSGKIFIKESDKWYLKEALAEVIYKLKEENRCWATYERNQGCFHVVSR